MRGSVRKRGSPGSWEYRLELGLQPAQLCRECGKLHWLERRPLDVCPCGGQVDDVQRRREKTQSGFRTKKLAQEALDRTKVAVQEGDYVAPSKVTVAEYLLRMWLPSVEASVRPSTFTSYRMHVEKYIVPRVGTIRLQRLGPDSIGAMYRDLLEDGRFKRGSRKGKAKDEDAEPVDAEPADAKLPLSPMTVRHTHAVLHRALRDAVKRQHVRRNAADAVDPPKVTGGSVHEMKVWTEAQAAAFLAATKGERLNPLWRLFLTCGLRRGEACGLQWKDVDFAEATYPDGTVSPGRLSIRRSLVTVGKEVHVQEPKTKRGRRVVPLSADTVAALREQAARQRDDAAAWGESWTDSGYVFTKEDGQPLHPDRVSAQFNEAQSRAPVPRIRLHDLRHTCGSLLIKKGVPVKVVSQMLGHSTSAFTIDVYQHVLPGMQEEAVAIMDSLLAVQA